MCIMCLEISKDRMTIREARSALTELVATTEDEQQLSHYKELSEATDEQLLELAKQAQK